MVTPPSAEVSTSYLDLSHLTFDQLDLERPQLCQRVRQHIDSLSQWFVNRDEVMEVATICALLGEPLLLFGPPGTAKSQLCTRFAESLHLSASERFSYLLTPFTEPSELFGPVDLDALKLGRFVRKNKGMITDVKVVFIDEIFKANSAILNALLSLLNEGCYYEEGQAKPSELQILFAAANELPTDPTLDALSDRFILKVPVQNTHHLYWDELLSRGLEAEGHATEKLAPWKNGPAQLIDLLKLRRYLQLSFIIEAQDPEIRDHAMPPQVMMIWRRIMSGLELDLGVYISDRKVIRIYKLLRARALIHGRSSVQLEDLKLLCYLAQRPGEHEHIAERVERLIALG